MGDNRETSVASTFSRSY